MSEDVSAEDLHEWAARRASWRWRSDGPCHGCGEWIGHFGGSAERDPCRFIPDDVPLVEVRPNCYDVRRMQICWAIRKATS